jgi:hypothetical protein
MTQAGAVLPPGRLIRLIQANVTLMNPHTRPVIKAYCLPEKDSVCLFHRIPLSV